MSRRETLASILVLCVVSVAARSLPHMANFAPVTATGLFCGAYMSRRTSLIVTPAILLLSDYALLYVSPFAGVHLDHVYEPWKLWYGSTQIAVYLSLGISTLAGWLLRRQRDPVLLAGVALFCSLQFFLITNAAVWLNGAYDRGLQGLWQSYVAGLPFFRGTALSDLFYTGAFFGLFELQRQAVRLSRSKTSYSEA